MTNQQHEKSETREKEQTFIWLQISVCAENQTTEKVYVSATVVPVQTFRKNGGIDDSWVHEGEKNSH